MSTENVSWSTPFGGSALGQAGDWIQDRTGMQNIQQGLQQALWRDPNAKYNPDGTPKPETGGPPLVTGNDSSGEQGYGPMVPYFAPQQSAKVNSVGAAPNSPRSAMALEERLRSSKRGQQNPNVEFSFNLQKNPIQSSVVRPMGGK